MNLNDRLRQEKFCNTNSTEVAISFSESLVALDCCRQWCKSISKAALWQYGIHRFLHNLDQIH